MKIFTYILIIISTLLIIFNITKLDFKNINNDESMIALIGIIASICAILILLIFKKSQMIAKKLKK